MKLKHLFVVCLFYLPGAASAQIGSSVFIEDLSWMEVRDRVAQGAHIALVPIGGTEQGGPQLSTGAHTMIMRFASADIARKVGGTLVAPVIPYTMSGFITPPEGHMQFAGTLSLREQTLSMLLTDVATSLKQHGFRLICLIGDSEGSQAVAGQVASQLNTAWAADGVRVLHVSDYAALDKQRQWAQTMGTLAQDPLGHGGMSDTSQLMSVSPQNVRANLIAAYGEHDYKTTGALADATQSSAAFGRGFLGVKISAAVQQIKSAAQRPE